MQIRLDMVRAFMEQQPARIIATGKGVYNIKRSGE
jgi:hypothetical protein